MYPLRALLIAGSLDIVHHHHILGPVAMPMCIEYLGVFLCLSSYLIVVKVGSGRPTVSSTGFPSSRFEMVDILQDTGADLVFLACTPRLYGLQPSCCPISDCHMRITISRWQRRARVRKTSG